LLKWGLLLAPIRVLSTTPASNHLFSVNQEESKLNEKSAEMFHHDLAEFFYLCKCACSDIQTAVAFLITRVKKPDEDDLKKLRRVIHNKMVG